MLPYVQGAHVEYSQALGENNKMETAGEKWKQNRRRLNNELKNAKRAKTESMTAHGKEMKKHDSKIHALEEELWSIKWSYQCLLFLLVIVFHKNFNTVRNRRGICEFFLAQTFCLINLHKLNVQTCKSFFTWVFIHYKTFAAGKKAKSLLIATTSG